MSISYVLYGHPILKKVLTPVTVINKELLELVGEMLVSMRLNHGVGLAANQVGVDLRVAVVSLEKGTKNFAILNPVILEKSKEKLTMNEGCLSLPGVYVPVTRSCNVIVRAEDLSGNEVVYQLTDLDARILQHEIDHLNGHCIMDLGK